jgi:hypothetical protein
MFTIPGTHTELPALVLSPGVASRDDRAWMNLTYLTVRLTDSVTAVRVHVGATDAAATADNVHLVTGAGAMGRWWAIGDFIKSYDDYINSASLPKTPNRHGRRSFFTRVLIAKLQPESVLNVGVASGLFGHDGGATQAEFLSGPAPSTRDISGVWANQYGHA